METKKLYYEDFGAAGDGVTNDFEAIRKTHEAANKTGATVCARDDATYYIGDADRMICIHTDVDWGKAHFIIDDREVGDDHRDLHIFSVEPDIQEYSVPVEELAGKFIAKSTLNIGMTFPYDALVYLRYAGHQIFNRWGINNKFSHSKDSQEVILVDREGNVDPSTPVLYHYDAVDEMKVYHLDEKPITLRGGIFTTYANKHERLYNYYHRGIQVRRPHTVLEGIAHYVEMEFENGAPYDGFYVTYNTTDVTFKNCLMTGRKMYRLKTDENNTMGSYDTMVYLSDHITWDGCDQTNSIIDTTYWGIHTADFCKNLTLKNSRLSRFDAHCGMHNCTILHSTLGSMLYCIGSGTLYIDGLTKEAGREFILLRNDYGATWDGDIVIKNSKFLGYKKQVGTEYIRDERGLYLFFASWYDWDFGYPCFMPRNITLENFEVGQGGDRDLTLFWINQHVEDKTKNPYDRPKCITLKKVTAKEVRLFDSSDSDPDFFEGCGLEYRVLD